MNMIKEINDIVKLNEAFDSHYDEVEEMAVDMFEKGEKMNDIRRALRKSGFQTDLIVKALAKVDDMVRKDI